jgi:hypothetical protein
MTAWADHCQTGSGGTHEFLAWLAGRSRPLHYSIGMTITEDMQEAILTVPAGHGRRLMTATAGPEPGTAPWVADITGLLGLSSCPAGMRVIVRKEQPDSRPRPHPKSNPS